MLKTLAVSTFFIVFTTGQKKDHFGSCYTDEECPGDAFCAIWSGCFMGTCVCSEDTSQAFGCLWKKVGDSCSETETKDCKGPPSECRDGKCSCPVNQSPARYSDYWCDGFMKAGRECSDNSVLRRGESCTEGKVACGENFREDPHTGECRSGIPGETCSKNEECDSNICTSNMCSCREEMAPYSEQMRFYSGRGYNVSSVKKCKPENAPSSSVGPGGTCGGYLTCQGSTCMECPEGGISVCVDFTRVGTITSLSSVNCANVPLLFLILVVGQSFFQEIWNKS